MNQTLTITKILLYKQKNQLSAKLNEILLQDELSNKIIVYDNSESHDGISKNLGNV